MPVPESHKKTFESKAAHAEQMARLFRDSNLIKALDALHDSADQRRAASGDPGGYLRQHGVRLPQNAKVIFDDNNWRLEIRISTDDCTYGFVYDTRFGGYTYCAGACC